MGLSKRLRTTEAMRELGEGISFDVIVRQIVVGAKGCQRFSWTAWSGRHFPSSALQSRQPAVRSTPSAPRTRDSVYGSFGVETLNEAIDQVLAGR